MSKERIRIGNTYHHSEYGDVVVTYRDHDNCVYFRTVVGRDNAGVINASAETHQEQYKSFLGNTTTRDYPDNWDSIAQAVKKRDNYECQACGTSDVELHVHHIVPLSAGGTNARSNLLTLCDKHHGRVHGGVT